LASIISCSVTWSQPEKRYLNAGLKKAYITWAIKLLIFRKSRSVLGLHHMGQHYLCQLFTLLAINTWLLSHCLQKHAIELLCVLKCLNLTTVGGN